VVASLDKQKNNRRSPRFFRVKLVLDIGFFQGLLSIKNAMENVSNPYMWLSGLFFP